MYQARANDEEDGLKIYPQEYENLKTSFHFQDYLKVAVFLSISFAFSFIAFSDKSSGISPFATQPSIAHILTLDDIPREAILGAYSDNDQSHLFGLFLKKYGKSYSSQTEYSSRFTIFKSSLLKADERNGKEKSRGSSKAARHGITKFSDLTEEEFKSAKKGRLPTTKSLADSKKEGSRNSGSKDKTEKTVDEEYLMSIPKLATVPKYTGTETSVDWSDIYTTKVRDQGYCGSCWAFSTAAQMESDAIRQGLLTTNDVLSVQQFIECDDSNWQCQGGWTEMAFSYAMSNGIMLESSYPYTSYYESYSPTCAADTEKYLLKVDSFFTIPLEDDMIDYVLSTGPLSGCVDSVNWDSYIDGIVTYCGSEADHCVQIVGVNTDEGYWKIRNTWGEDWGEGGYIRVSTGSNTCGVTSDPLFSIVSLVDSEYATQYSEDSLLESQSPSTTDSPTKKPTDIPTVSPSNMKSVEIDKSTPSTSATTASTTTTSQNVLNNNNSPSTSTVPNPSSSSSTSSSIIVSSPSSSTANTLSSKTGNQQPSTTTTATSSSSSTTSSSSSSVTRKCQHQKQEKL